MYNWEQTEMQHVIWKDKSLQVQSVSNSPVFTVQLNHFEFKSIFTALFIHRLQLKVFDNS